MRIVRSLESFFLWSVPLFLLLITSGAVTEALPYGAGTYGTCTYNTCSISLTASGTVSLNVVPASGGVHTTASDTVTVETGSSTGYTLIMQNADTDTALTNGANTLAATTGTQASPVTLALNTWGYRVDGLSGFGAGPTSVQNNEPSSTYTFAGVPASDVSAHTLKTTSSAADPPEITLVWYGVRADGAKPSGTYSDQVTYTAVTND